MDNILHYLELITQPDHLGPEHSALMQQVIQLEKPIQDVFSLDYLDALSQAQSDVLRHERRECFSRGFRLGARLILAALAVPSAPDTRHRS